MNTGKYKDATVVLAHAAWADASSWNKIIPQLQRIGLQVMSAQLPLTSLLDDVAALQQALARARGPVVLAAHSYGGAVITAAAVGKSQVKALVYIAAMAPDEGELVGQLLQRAEEHPKAPQLAPDENGLIWMSAEGFANAVAPESSPEELALMTATQKPINVKCLGEAMSRPAWREKPSWYLLAEKDRMIAPATQRFMAERMQAHIDSRDVDHTPLASAPESVARIIVTAVDGSI